MIRLKEVITVKSVLDLSDLKYDIPDSIELDEDFKQEYDSKSDAEEFDKIRDKPKSRVENFKCIKDKDSYRMIEKESDS